MFSTNLYSWRVCSDLISMTTLKILWAGLELGHDFLLNLLAPSHCYFGDSPPYNHLHRSRTGSGRCICIVVCHCSSQPPAWRPASRLRGMVFNIQIWRFHIDLRLVVSARCRDQLRFPSSSELTHYGLLTSESPIVGAMARSSPTSLALVTLFVPPRLEAGGRPEGASFCRRRPILLLADDEFRSGRQRNFPMDRWPVPSTGLKARGGVQDARRSVLPVSLHVFVRVLFVIFNFLRDQFVPRDVILCRTFVLQF